MNNRDGATFHAAGLTPGTYRLLGAGRIADVWSFPLKELRIESGKNVATEVSLR